MDKIIEEKFDAALDPIPDISGSIRRSYNSLRKNKFTKLICAASNTNCKQIERLSLIYSLSGIDVIDLSCNKEVYAAALSGIAYARKIYNLNPKLYPDFREPVLMISISVGNDPHFRKATFNQAKCLNCFKCLNVCPAKALIDDFGVLKFNRESCYGCGRCLKECGFDAIKLEQVTPSIDIDFFIENKIKAIEVHTGNSAIDNVLSFIECNAKLFEIVELVSFSIESNMFSRDKLLEYVHFLIKKFDKKIIIQLDGTPMGASNLNASSLQALAAAEILLNANIDSYIQIAGGCNHLTRKYLSLLNLKISGIGYGTFARKIILPYIEGFNDAGFYRNIFKCVKITTDLVRK